MDPAQGSGIMFNVIPFLFVKIPGGMFFGPLFFALLALAALTSTISMLEVPVSYLIDQKGWGRKKAAYIIGGIALLIGIPSALSQGALPALGKLPLFNIDFFGLWNLVWGNLSLSVGAFFIAIFVGYIWKSRKAVEEIRQGSRFMLAPVWSFLIKFVSPVLILLILLGIFI